jgi:hypothetical protein
MITENCIGLQTSIIRCSFRRQIVCWPGIFHNKLDLAFTMNKNPIYLKGFVDKSITFEMFHNCAL